MSAMPWTEMNLPWEPSLCRTCMTRPQMWMRRPEGRTWVRVISICACRDDRADWDRKDEARSIGDAFVRLVYEEYGLDAVLQMAARDRSAS